MTSPTPSSAIERMKPYIQNVTFVIVPGLRKVSTRENVSKSSSWPIFWEPGGALRLQFPGPDCIQFNPEFGGEILQNLTPEWFKHKAENLIKHISNERRSESNQLVFVCEDLGGIIVKKALTLEGSHTDLIRKTSIACLFFGVPHQDPTLNSWTRALKGILSFWGVPGQDQWMPAPQFLTFLGNTSFQFNQVALWLGVITVYQLHENGDATAPLIKQPCATLDLSHEIQVSRKFCLGDLVRFDPAGDRDAQNVVDALARAVKDQSWAWLMT